MDFISLGQKVEVLWEDHISHLIKMKSVLFLQAQLTKVSYLYVIGRLVQLMRLEAKMIL